jgi:hypothetical protein
MTKPLGRRIFLAHLELSYRLGRKVTLAEFGELTARQMNRGTPFTAASVSRWESGAQVPLPPIIEAIGALTGTDPGWLSHGHRSAAPAPERVVASGGLTADDAVDRGRADMRPRRSPRGAAADPPVSREAPPSRARS